MLFKCATATSKQSQKTGENLILVDKKCTSSVTNTISDEYIVIKGRPETFSLNLLDQTKRSLHSTQSNDSVIV